MDPTSVERLQSFISQFNITDLGDGDHVAGVNILASFISTLANISPPGSGILTENGRTFEIGTNLVVSGGLTASLYQDLVGSQLARHQAAFNSHTKSFLKATEEDQKSANPHDWSRLPELDSTSAQDTFFGLQQKGHYPGESFDQEWQRILANPPQRTRDELYRNTQVYLRTSDPGKSDQCLASAHKGRLFLHFSLQSPKQFHRHHPLLSKIIDGYQVGTLLPTFHQGFVLVDDCSNSYYQVIKNGPRSFPRFVWLLDGGLGMDLPVPPAAPTTLVTHPVELRHLTQSLLTAFARRVNHHKTDPQLFRYELSPLHTRWVRFLQTQEDSYPGITSTAKKLLATLHFGMQCLSNTYRRACPKTGSPQSKGVSGG